MNPRPPLLVAPSVNSFKFQFVLAGLRGWVGGGYIGERQSPEVATAARYCFLLKCLVFKCHNCASSGLKKKSTDTLPASGGGADFTSFAECVVKNHRAAAAASAPQSEIRRDPSGSGRPNLICDESFGKGGEIMDVCRCIYVH